MASVRKMTDSTRQKWIDAGLEDSYNELLDRDGISKSEGWSLEQKEAIRATLTFLCQEAYEAGHSARQKDRVVTGSDVDRRIETVLSEIEAITKGEQ